VYWRAFGLSLFKNVNFRSGVYKYSRHGGLYVLKILDLMNLESISLAFRGICNSLYDYQHVFLVSCVLAVLPRMVMVRLSIETYQNVTRPMRNQLAEREFTC
jgi:hypothetical protein